MKAKWRPKRWTGEQLEERRIAGMQLLRAGKLSQTEMARRLGVSRMSVYGWKRAYGSGGRKALKQRKASGRPSKLSVKEREQLLHILEEGALKAGFKTERWTLKRVQQVLQREFNVPYHVNSLHRLLRGLGSRLKIRKPCRTARVRISTSKGHLKSL
jgi:putative transposase